MEALGPILLLAGVLALLYGTAALSGTPVAARSRMRRHSSRYALLALGSGLVLAAVGIGLLLA